VYPGLDTTRLEHMAAAFQRFMGGERVPAGLV
jgi:hypothetical protein